MNDKRTEPGARTDAGPSAGLKQFLHFEGGIEDLALAADTVLSSLGALAGEDGGSSLNARLIRGLDPKRTRLVQKNNGNDMVFWTHTESPVLPSHDEPPPAK